MTEGGGEAVIDCRHVEKEREKGQEFHNFPNAHPTLVTGNKTTF